MTESAPTAKSYRDYAVTLREAANDVASHENRAYLRSFADNYDNIAASIENAAMETVLLHCRRTGTPMDEIDTWRTAGSLTTQHVMWLASPLLSMLMPCSPRTTT